MYLRKLFKKDHLSVLAVVATITLLTISRPVFAAASINMATVETSSMTSLIQTIANVLAAIGAGVILIYGMLHTFGVASAGKNANKRAMAMESLGYVFLSIFIFFSLHGLGGVIRGVAEGSFGAGQ